MYCRWGRCGQQSNAHWFQQSLCEECFHSHPRPHLLAAHYGGCVLGLPNHFRLHGEAQTSSDVCFIQRGWGVCCTRWALIHSHSWYLSVSVFTVSFIIFFLQTGIALYPGKAQLLSCMHHYHDNIPPLVALDRPEERNCIKEDVIYHGPYSNQTQVCFRSSSNLFWRNGAINNLWRNMSVAEASYSRQRTDWREEPRAYIPPVQPEWNGRGFQRNQLHDFCQI